MTDPKARAVTVRIGGKDYPIRSDADPAYTRRCAEYVDNRISGIGKDLGALDIQKLTILAALSITDSLFQMQEDDECLSREVTAAIDSMVDQLEQAILEK